jgi:hypothetical protein
MESGEIRTRMLQLIGLTKASAELQEGFVYAYERIARRRMGHIVRQMLSDEQADRVRRMRESGMPDNEVLAWVKSQMTVDIDTLYWSVVQAVMAEVYQTPTKDTH